MSKGEIVVVFLVGLAVGSFLSFQQYRYARDVCEDFNPPVAEATVPVPEYYRTTATLWNWCRAGRFTCVGNISTIAEAIHRHATELGMEPIRVTAVMLMENPWLDPSIRGRAGEDGLMQIMPLWRGVFPDCGDHLTSIED